MKNEQSATNPEVKELLLQITPECNLSCYFCGNDPNKKSEKIVMEFETIKSIVDKINPSSASFTGGEVTLEWERLVEGLKYTKSKGIFNIVNTCLSLLSTEQIDYLINDCGVGRFHVSFNDLDEQMSEEVRGSSRFRERVMSNIQYITKNYPNVALHVETLLLKKTIKKIPEIHIMLANLGVRCHKLSFMTPLGHAKNIEVPKFEEIKEAILNTYKVKRKGCLLYLVCCYLTPCMEEAKEIYEINDEEFRVMQCSEGRHTLYIAADGKISPCFIFHGEIGNVKSDNVREIWENGELFQKWRNEVNEECKQCEHWYAEKAVSCHNGCATLLLMKTGNLKMKCGEYMRDCFESEA